MRVPKRVSRFLIGLGVLAAIAAATDAFVILGRPREFVLAVTTIGWPREFSSDAWLDHTDKRYYMAFDLAGTELLRGKTEVDLRRMLGEPDAEGDRTMTWSFTYPFGPDTNALTVWLVDGRVAEWTTPADLEMGPVHE